MDVLLFVAGSAGWPGGNQDRRRPPAASPRWGENVRGFWQSDGADHVAGIRSRGEFQPGAVSYDLLVSAFEGHTVTCARNRSVVPSLIRHEGIGLGCEGHLHRRRRPDVLEDLDFLPSRTPLIHQFYTMKLISSREAGRSLEDFNRSVQGIQIYRR